MLGGLHQATVLGSKVNVSRRNQITPPYICRNNVSGDKMSYASPKVIGNVRTVTCSSVRPATPWTASREQSVRLGSNMRAMASSTSIIDCEKTYDGGKVTKVGDIGPCDSCGTCMW